MTDSDAVLVGRARQGDAEAFEALVRRHLRSAYAMALSRVREPADAEDVAQDAFLTALQRLEECRNPAQFGSWLLTIVRNKAMDVHRYRSVRDALPLERACEVSDGASPQREAERAELREDLLTALDGLTPLQREVILLYDIEGWSHKEISRRLGVSEGSARVHLHNARKALRARLGERHRE
ncbi:MAG: sigma-70 family RNA polymerase sigma factor [Gemmatimonadetes bacterium]|nr:sigma-70 family RNA polymerase sigma factor [Gemmatimonadota bacterium]